MNKPNHKVIMRRIFGPKHRPGKSSKPVRHVLVRQNVHIHVNPRYFNSPELLTSAVIANVSEALASSLTADMSGSLDTRESIPCSNEPIVDPEMVPLTPAPSPPATTMDLIENDVIAIPEAQIPQALTEILRTESDVPIDALSNTSDNQSEAYTSNDLTESSNSDIVDSFNSDVVDKSLEDNPQVSEKIPKEPSIKRNRENENIEAESEEPNILDIVLKEYRSLRKKAKKNKTKELSVTKLPETMTGFSKIYASAVLPRFKPLKRHKKTKKLKPVSPIKVGFESQ